MKFIRTAVLLTAFLLSAHAHADCTGPAGTEGKAIYNSMNDVMQYCDGTDWIAFPKADNTADSWATANQNKGVAQDAAASDQMGFSAAISGNYALIGAYNKNTGTGAVFAYVKTNGVWIQTQKLTSSDIAAGDQFGYSVSMSGTYAIIGARSDDDGASNAGSAYIFTRSGDTWSQSVKLAQTDVAANDNFGHSVSIDGNVAVVGSVNDDIGAEANAGTIYIFTRSGASWPQTGKYNASDYQAGDWFGSNVRISGTTIVVGADGEDTAGSQAGAAYIFTNNAGTWSQTQKLIGSDTTAADQFGRGVAISGTTLAIGARYNDDTASNSGSVYIYTKSGPTWTQTQKINVSDPEADDLFGQEIEISGNTLVATALQEDAMGSNAGAVYIFTSTAGTFSQTQKIVAADGAAGDQLGSAVGIFGTDIVVGAWGEDDGGSNAGAAYFFSPGKNSKLQGWDQTPVQTKTTAPDGVASQYYGIGAAIDGDLALVSARGDNGSRGAGYVLRHTNAGWTHEAKLTASDSAASDAVSYTVDIKGDVAAMGTIMHMSSRGAVYIFNQAGSAWTQTQKLQASDGAASDQFGSALALSDDTLLVGAPKDDASLGAVYVFTRSGNTWTQAQKLLASDGVAGDNFGYSVAIYGDTAFIGAYADDSSRGSVYVFNRSGGVWSQAQKLQASDGVANDWFGYHLSLSGNVAVVGAYKDEADKGGAYVFRKAGTTWVQYAKLTASDGVAGDWFGHRVAVSGNAMLISAYRANSQTGKVYAFTNRNGIWTQQQIITASDGAASDWFGVATDLSGNRAIMGAYGDDDLGNLSGSTYFFTAPWACTGPARRPGTIIYNDDDRVLQWCGGDTWYGAGPNNPTTPETGCNTPSGTGGDTIYNADYNTLQYCDGGSWIAIGK